MILFGACNSAKKQAPAAHNTVRSDSYADGAGVLVCGGIEMSAVFVSRKTLQILEGEAFL
jgi:hypothetical protein